MRLRKQAYDKHRGEKRRYSTKSPTLNAVRAKVSLAKNLRGFQGKLS
jgi:hypothetical protein